MALEFYNKYISKCPGSLMILGEHAVLYGASCIVAAIDEYLTVQLEIYQKNNFTTQITISTDIDSDKYNNFSFYLEELDSILNKHSKLIYLLTVIKFFENNILDSGLDYKFTISSQINPTMGLGSSAAVTVASIDVILKALGQKTNKKNLLSIGTKIINTVQGKGSGADIAASIYGNVLLYNYNYNTKEQTVEVIAEKIPITVIYSGYKLSTKEVIKIIENKIKNKNNKDIINNIYNYLFELINHIVIQAKEYIQNKNWIELGRLFNIHYGLQEALGTSDNNLSNIVYFLRSYSEIYGAKISGSGLGDCVIGLGKIKDSINNFNNFNIQYLDLEISNKGLS